MRSPNGDIIQFKYGEDNLNPVNYIKQNSHIWKTMEGQLISSVY